MESVQKAVYAVSEGIRNRAFGSQTQNTSTEQHGEEPLSGVQGRGTATDPYDAGNRDEQPDAPQTQANTAVTPEPVESITPIESRPTDLSSAHGSTATSPPGISNLESTYQPQLSRPRTRQSSSGAGAGAAIACAAAIQPPHHRQHQPRARIENPDHVRER